MIYANKEEEKTVIAAKGSRTKVLQEFAYIARKLVEAERENGRSGEVIRELADAALMTEEETEKEIVKTEKEIMDKLPGTEEEKQRMMEVLLAMME